MPAHSEGIRATVEGLPTDPKALVRRYRSALAEAFERLAGFGYGADVKEIADRYSLVYVEPSAASGFRSAELLLRGLFADAEHAAKLGPRDISASPEHVDVLGDVLVGEPHELLRLRPNYREVGDREIVPLVRGGGLRYPFFAVAADGGYLGVCQESHASIIVDVAGRRQGVLTPPIAELEQPLDASEWVAP